MEMVLSAWVELMAGGGRNGGFLPLPPLRVLGQRVPDPKGVRSSQEGQFNHQSTWEAFTELKPPPGGTAGCSTPAGPGGAAACRIEAFLAPVSCLDGSGSAPEPLAQAEFCFFKRFKRERPRLPHLDDPDEDLQLVDVQLQVHAVRQPGSDQVHGAGVPLLP